MGGQKVHFAGLCNTKLNCDTQQTMHFNLKKNKQKKPEHAAGLLGLSHFV